MSVKKIVLLNVFIVVGVFVVAVVVSYVQKENLVREDERRREALYAQILGGASTKPAELRVDFSKQISTGSPLIFGGAHTPPLEHQDAWDKIADVGVTSVRVDFALDRILPRNITLEDYKANKNGVQFPENWNQKNIIETVEVFNNAKKRGMKVIGIIDYSVNWLSYSNSPYGVPRDWNVYKDIVKKTYKIYRPYVDYLEIWNEPNLQSDRMFLNISGSNQTKKEAYEQIYFHASSAIREVDAEINDGKKMPLGGPVSYTKDDASFLEPLLSNPENAKNLDFISYHQYESSPTESNIKYKEILKKYNKLNLPILLTEWSYSSKGKEVVDVIPTDAGITYAGSMFLNYLRMGVKAANYHTLTELRDKKPYGLEKNHAFYKWDGSQAELLPLSRTWQILNKQMGLGNGESKIYSVKHEIEKLDSVGFKNIEGQYGVVIVNTSSDKHLVELNLGKTDISSYATAKVYYASASNEAKTPVYDGVLKTKEGNISFVFYTPEESVVGIIFTEDQEWFEDINLPFNN